MRIVIDFIAKLPGLTVKTKDEKDFKGILTELFYYFIIFFDFHYIVGTLPLI